MILQDVAFRLALFLGGRGGVLNLVFCFFPQLFPDISGIRPWVAGLPKAALMEAMKGAWSSPVNINSRLALVTIALIYCTRSYLLRFPCILYLSAGTDA